MSHRLLVVDDDDENNYSTKVFLESNGYSVDTVASGKQAIDLIRTGKKTYALILMDYEMPDMDGAESGREILALLPRQQIAMYTCHDQDVGAVKKAIQSGLVDFIEKQMDTDEFLGRIAELCAKYDRTIRPVTTMVETTEVQQLLKSANMVGCSPQIIEVAAQIHKFAPIPETVIIHGESGTGKELVAKALHDLSPRKNNPFIAVNCTAIPEALIESTLFGHEKGAFTGAVKNQLGKFVLANHGTLFLDEIGDMPLSFQVKLLRVLQEREVEPVGATSLRPVDVRVITASHKNLEDQVAKGLFREDLYHRLNVLKIEIPALRDRPEDIEPLVAYFTKEHWKSMGLSSGRYFESATLPVLKSYRWPGNVRELKNAVDQHLIITSGPSVRYEDLQGKLYKVTSNRGIGEIEERYRAEMKTMIENARAKSPTKTEAARSLGMSPSKFSYYEKTFCMV
jgi:DNA-binding NtrC family response regulator